MTVYSPKSQHPALAPASALFRGCTVFRTVLIISLIHFPVHPCDQPSRGGCNQVCNKAGDVAICSCRVKKKEH